MLKLVLIEDKVHSIDLTWLESGDNLTAVHLVCISEEVSRVISFITLLLNDIQKMSRSPCAIAEEVVCNIDIYNAICVSKDDLRTTGVASIKVLPCS